MAFAAAGYSGTPLAAKLGMKDGMNVAFVGLPPELDELTTCRTFARVDRVADWRSVEGHRLYDLMHAFSKQRAEITEGLPRLQDAITADGTIWVSWPKKASKVLTDVTENVVRDIALELDLVDVKVAAIDEIWSGLKLVIRKDRR